MPPSPLLELIVLILVMVVLTAVLLVVLYLTPDPCNCLPPGDPK